jgi:hypothetical protein
MWRRAVKSYEVFQEVIEDSKNKLYYLKWLRHCATNWKVAGLIPDEVNF